MRQEQLELFNGSDYEPCRDSKRLSAQHNRIKNLMLDGQARTLFNLPSQSIRIQALK
jgi:hypothetical protein